MPSPLSTKSTNFLLLSLLNSLSDFDGHISEHAAAILSVLRHRPDSISPLYADVFRLPFSATCTDLVERIESLTQDQVMIASDAFQIFRSYEQLLKVNTTDVAPEQKVAYESQLERIRIVVARTRSALAEAMGDHREA
jgi:hypothetical protein